MVADWVWYWAAHWGKALEYCVQALQARLEAECTAVAELQAKTDGVDAQDNTQQKFDALKDELMEARRKTEEQEAAMAEARKIAEQQQRDLQKGLQARHDYERMEVKPLNQARLDIVMVYVVMAYVVMAYVVMAYVAMIVYGGGAPKPGSAG